MDVRVTSTNKTFCQIDSQFGALLCEALPTVFERVDKPAEPQPPRRARWSLGKTHKQETFLRVICDTCRKNSVYYGLAEDIPRFEKTLCTHAGMVPDDLVAEYKQKYTGDLDRVVMAEPTGKAWQ